MIRKWEALFSMENEMSNILKLLNDMNQNINTKLATIESRVARLEKMDSIEHRVTVNQIDITDIKELLQKLEDNPTNNFAHIIEQAITRFESTYQTHLELLNRRLDSQLLKIARAEEEILILKQEQQ